MNMNITDSQKEGSTISKALFYETQTVSTVFSSETKLPINEFIEVSLIEKGNGTLCILDKSIPCSKGELYIVAPNMSHNFFVSKADDIMVVRKLLFDISDWFIGDIASKDSPRYCYSVFQEGAVVYANLTEQSFIETKRLLDNIVYEYEKKYSEWYDAIRANLSLLFILIRRYVDNAIKTIASPSQKGGEIVLSMIRIIEERYKDYNLTLATIASTLFASPSNLSRIFRNYMGQSFSEFLWNFRMDKACRLLTETDESISDVVNHCGLRDVPSFYKSFSRYSGTTPYQYRSKTRKRILRKEIGADKISILNEISENLQNGKTKIVKELVQKALDEGIDAKTTLEEGLISGMTIIGEKFKNNVIYIPEVLVAARAFNYGTQILKPCFESSGMNSAGRVCIGTVQGDMHDIGKNLVKMMMEGKKLEVIDLGTNVAPEAFVKTAIEQNCQIICCSALLSTTMSVMKEVVNAATTAGIREQIKIMVGGAPVNEAFCKEIGADAYTEDAISAAEVAVELCKALK